MFTPYNIMLDFLVLTRFWLKPLTKIVAVAFVIALTACGGDSGGGDDDDNKASFSIVYPTAETLLTNENNQSFVVRSDSVINSNSFKAEINEVEANSLFTLNGNTASADFFQVKGLLQDGNNRFIVSINEQELSVNFTADIVSGELIITAVRGDAEQGFLISGVTRKPGLESVIINGIEANVNGKSFSSALSTEGPFNFVANYANQTQSVQMIANPQYIIEEQSAFQLNNAAFDVLTPMLSELVNAAISDSLQVPIEGRDICQIFKDASIYSYCKLSIEDFGVLNGVPSIDDGNITDLIPRIRFGFNPTPSAGYQTEFIAELGINWVRARVDYFRDGQAGQVEVFLPLLDDSTIGLQLAGLFNGTYPQSIHLALVENDTVDVELFAAAGSGEGITFNCFDGQSTTCPVVSINALFGLEFPNPDGSDSTVPFNQFLELEFEKTLDEPSVETGSGELISFREAFNENATFESLQVISTIEDMNLQPIEINQLIQPANLATAVDGEAANHGVFLGFSGANYAAIPEDSNATLAQSLGFRFDVASPQWAGRLNNNENSISVALTKNMLNQALLTLFKTEQINTLSVDEILVPILGINVSLSADIALKTVPYINLSRNNLMKFNAQEATVSLRYQGGVDVILTPGAELFVTTLDLSGDLYLSTESGKPKISIPSDGVAISIIDVEIKAAGNELGLSEPLIKGLLVAELPAIIAATLGEVGTALIPSLGSFNIDVENFITQSNDETKQTIRGLLPKIYSLSLSTDGIVVDPLQIIFSGELEETTDSANSLFSIRFCSSNSDINDSAKCPN